MRLVIFEKYSYERFVSIDNELFNYLLKFKKFKSIQSNTFNV